MRQWRKISRLIGLALLLGVFLTLAVEIFGWWQDSAWQIITLGSTWATINANSLVGLGAFIENSISPWLWIEIMVPLLTLPLWLYLGLSGAFLVIITRQKRRKTIFYKR